MQGWIPRNTTKVSWKLAIGDGTLDNGDNEYRLGIVHGDNVDQRAAYIG